MDDKAQRAAIERQAANYFASFLPADQLDRWNASTYVGRFHFRGEDLLKVVRTNGSFHAIVETLAPTAMCLSFDSGMELRLVGHETDIWVSHHPRLLDKHNVFVWLPSFQPDLRYVSTKEHFGLSVNICFKSARSPGRSIDGNTYLQK